MWTVSINHKFIRKLSKLPVNVQQRFEVLLLDLEETGPVQPSWKNYSKINKNKYHCHLTYKYVACWSYTYNTIEIEVYYVGTRENAPYK